MENITVDEELLAKIDFKEIESAGSIAETSYNVWYVFDLIIQYMIQVVSAASALLIFHLIRKSKILQTPVNIYFMHYALLSAVFLLVSVFDDIMFKLDRDIMPGTVTFAIICPIYTLQAGSFVAFFSFLAFMAIDWLLLLHSEKMLQKFETYQKHIIHAIYAISVAEMVLLITKECWRLQKILGAEPLFITVLLAGVVLIIANLATFWKKAPEDALKSKHAIIIANLVGFTCLFVLITEFSFIRVLLISESGGLSIIGYVLDFVISFLFYGTNFILILWWMRSNDDFRRVLRTFIAKLQRKDGENGFDGRLWENEEGINDEAILI